MHTHANTHTHTHTHMHARTCKHTHTHTRTHTPTPTHQHTHAYASKHTHTHTHTHTYTHTHTHTQPNYFVQFFDCGSDCGPQHPVRFRQIVLISALVVVNLAQLQTVSTQAQRVSNAHPSDTKASFEQQDPKTLING